MYVHTYERIIFSSLDAGKLEYFLHNPHRVSSKQLSLHSTRGVVAVHSTPTLVVPKYWCNRRDRGTSWRRGHAWRSCPIIIHNFITSVISLYIYIYIYSLHGTFHLSSGQPCNSGSRLATRSHSTRILPRVPALGLTLGSQDGNSTEQRGQDRGPTR